MSSQSLRLVIAPLLPLRRRRLPSALVPLRAVRDCGVRRRGLVMLPREMRTGISLERRGILGRELKMPGRMSMRRAGEERLLSLLGRIEEMRTRRMRRLRGRRLLLRGRRLRMRESLVLGRLVPVLELVPELLVATPKAHQWAAARA